MQCLTFPKLIFITIFSLMSFFSKITYSSFLGEQQFEEQNKLISHSSIEKLQESKTSVEDNVKQWIVIGAGPSGIATIGKLLDSDIQPQKIGWIDPFFEVGDLGGKWRPVSSNTDVNLFLKFLNACHSFNYKNCPIDFKINHFPLDSTCLLNDIADPLQWVTNQLKEKIDVFKTTATQLEYSSNIWKIETQDGKIFANNVVLAIGADPLSLPLSGPSTISIEQMVDLNLLKKVCTKEDTVAVFGSSHTAIIALYNLDSIGAKVINFYRSPLKYAIYYDDWILFDNTGLKGYSAEWARENIEKNQSDSLKRIQINDNKFKDIFATCNKAIYAVGFERRKSITLLPDNNFKYDESTGIIAPGLFGIGIAFPQGKFDRKGNYEHNVGLWKFMSYLENILPTWLQKKQ